MSIQHNNVNDTLTPTTGMLSVTGTAAFSGGIIFNATTISTNTTVPSSYNALTSGPVAVNSGVVVTVPSGSVWTVV